MVVGVVPPRPPGVRVIFIPGGGGRGVAFVATPGSLGWGEGERKHNELITRNNNKKREE